MQQPIYPHLRAFERMRGEDSWEGLLYDDPLDLPCYYHARTSNVGGGGDPVAPVQSDRARVPVTESVAPGIGDKLGGTTIEAYDDVLDTSGNLIERVVYLEPRR